MAKQSIVVELDDETIRSLAVLGQPNEVLARLADSAIESVHRPDHQRRARTDESLRIERDKADDRDAEALGPLDERAAVDAMLAHERVERRRRNLAGILAHERQATDEDLTGERAHVDSLLVDQREANARMVRATIRAHELADAADAAMERAEESARELRRVAEFRELFMGILGHDLRNPLASIVTSAAALLRRGHVDEHDAKTAARIIRSSQRMSRMISEMLDFTRARLGGGFPIDPQPTDMGDVCRNVVEEFEATIQLEVEGDVTGVWDQDRLAEVLSNLAGNAIEHAAWGTIARIKAYAEGAEVIVEVSNQGDDIPADVHPFIFEPFRRAKQHEKSATGNLGLGLYIAHEIVLSHGGTLEAHSAGGTTTFVMRLPRRSPSC
ncbi:sensor histidine kinase [Polyangium fumosum]|uniref:histidine kinase n=1 Tax=Polyangium fumosum TaxID=889272 RepID=A0A4U1J629_9BACT|nr:HAMP domain-containing sensor histidine kinase [Polyangium fumosum]TKD02749.1 HAMP domain-containing histidine kinase [Polyangium fumosum]